MRIKLMLILCLSVLAVENAKAQNVSLSTNLLEWANFGTANMEAGFSVHKNISLHFGAKYNPWEFETSRLHLDLYNKQTTGYLGVKYWPWHVFSGWWVGVRTRVTDYANTGIWRPALNQGLAVGCGLSFGYTLMLHERLNIEFGIGVWGGRRFDYTLYCCTDCMNIRETGAHNFISYDDVSVSLMHVF
jgi:hypothetical protein